MSDTRRERPVFVEARREAQPIAVGLAGPAGSGKTLSAIYIAMGLAGNGRIAIIDTEQGRALQYVGRETELGPVNFLYCRISAPFTPEKYIDALEVAREDGSIGAVIVDSASHEWEGMGGILKIQEAEFKRLGSKDSVKLLSWVMPKNRHDAFVSYIEQYGKHLVLCYRAKEKLKPTKMVKNGKEVTEPVNIGWTPITGDRLDYHMTLTLVMPPGSQGRPDLAEKSTKFDKISFPFVVDGHQLSIETGKQLRLWSLGIPYERATITNDVPTDDRTVIRLRALVVDLQDAQTPEDYRQVADTPKIRDAFKRLEKERPELWEQLSPLLDAARKRVSEGVAV